MSIDFQEAEYEEFMEKLFEENKDIALAEFKNERLASYYLDKESLAEPAYHALGTAKQLLDEHPTASFVFATIAIEFSLKYLVVIPFFYGLIHTEAIAAIVAELMLKMFHRKDILKMIFTIDDIYLHIGLRDHKMADSTNTIWHDINNIQKKRNIIIHKAKRIIVAEANDAYKVASEIINIVFPEIIKCMGYHLHDGYKICNRYDCKPDHDTSHNKET